MPTTLAVASLIPGLGLILGPVAVAYGVEGLRYAGRSPRHIGRTHAWVALILGSLTAIANLCGMCIGPMLFLNSY